ncbi:MAG TPA: hypothetical protein VII56_17255 [Rhizomicrobium sp.]
MAPDLSIADQFSELIRYEGQVRELASQLERIGLAGTLPHLREIRAHIVGRMEAIQDDAYSAIRVE